MFKNYFNVAVRNLLKHKFYSSINILGLTVGVTCFLLIFLYVKHELSYDSYHQDAENIYRIDFDGNLNGSEFRLALVGPPVAEAMISDFPEVLDGLRFRHRGRYLIKKEGTEQNIEEPNIAFVDHNFFTFFSIDLVQGEERSVLENPNSMAISRSAARKYFGDEDPIGKVLILDNEFNYTVTGVYNDIPENTHFNFDVLMSMATNPEAQQKIWLSMNFNTYLKLKPGTDVEAMQSKFPAMLEKYIGPEIKRFMNISMDQFYEAGNRGIFSLISLKDIHLHSDKQGELQPNGDIKYIYIFGAIAIFILLIACINYMNLSTARSSARAKEVGIRKVLGAYRPQLIKQFLAEAILLSVVSFVLSYVLAIILLGPFNELANKELTSSYLLKPEFIISMGIITLIVGILAGSYPAFFLAKFRPVEVLKGKLNLGVKSGALRSILVVFQFTLSILMMVGTAVIFDQLNYIQNKKLGFEKDQVIMLHDAWVLGDRVESFKTEALRNTRIRNGTISSFLPVGTSDNNTVFFPGQNAEGNNTYVVANWRIDHDYIPTLGMQMALGRNFSKDFLSDSSAIIINEAAAAQFGLTDPIGKIISTYDGDNEGDLHVVPYKIIGVVEDFHFASLREHISPLVLYLGRTSGYISFKVDGQEVEQTIANLENLWQEFAPGQPFAYSFMDQRFDALYTSEQKIGNIFSVFAILAIFIACLGMFGLASFTADQRTKEIGIRKVLGASIVGIIALLSKEFVKLVIISFLIAAPMAYYFMGMWLEDFAFRTDLSLLTFVMSGLWSMLIALATMSYQSLKAAHANPVQSLRDE